MPFLWVGPGFDPVSHTLPHTETHDNMHTACTSKPACSFILKHAYCIHLSLFLCLCLSLTHSPYLFLFKTFCSFSLSQTHTSFSFSCSNTDRSTESQTRHQRCDQEHSLAEWVHSSLENGQDAVAIGNSLPHPNLAKSSSSQATVTTQGVLHALSGQRCRTVTESPGPAVCCSGKSIRSNCVPDCFILITADLPAWQKELLSIDSMGLVPMERYLSPIHWLH
jgi:hypothetical protein